MELTLNEIKFKTYIPLGMYIPLGIESFAEYQKNVFEHSLSNGSLNGAQSCLNLYRFATNDAVEILGETHLTSEKLMTKLSEMERVYERKTNRKKLFGGLRR